MIKTLTKALISFTNRKCLIAYVLLVSCHTTMLMWPFQWSEAKYLTTQNINCDTSVCAELYNSGAIMKKRGRKYSPRLQTATTVRIYTHKNILSALPVTENIISCRGEYRSWRAKIPHIPWENLTQQTRTCQVNMRSTLPCSFNMAEITNLQLRSVNNFVWPMLFHIL